VEGTLRAAVIEDHPVYRDGLVRMLEAMSAIRQVLAAASLAEYLAIADNVDLALLDLHLPDASRPVDAVRAVCTTTPLVLVVSASDQFEEVTDALAAGAKGYVTKAATEDEIGLAVMTVAQGQTYVSPALAAHLLRTPAQLSDLSDREREILALVAEGETDRDIAERLCLSVYTVRSHLDRIRTKTGKRRRADLTRLAVEHHIT
jgi:DNA-binding NarL/FixJ family response regulator